MINESIVDCCPAWSRGPEETFPLDAGSCPGCRQRCSQDDWGAASAVDQSFSMITFALPHDPGTTGKVLPAGRLSRWSRLGTDSQRGVDPPPYLQLEMGLSGKQRTDPDLSTASIRAGSVRSKRAGRIMFPVATKGDRHRSSDGVRIVGRNHQHHSIVRVHLSHTAKRRTGQLAKVLAGMTCVVVIVRSARP